MIVCGALVVPPSSRVFIPQELTGKLVALDYGNGTAYAGLQMLEGAMARADITTRAFDADPARRFAALMDGEFEATVLQEPYITVAEKAGCRLISTVFFHGTWVADGHVDTEMYAAFLRGLNQAVDRINADKRAYVHYYMDDFPNDPLVQALTPYDFSLGRIQLRRPVPIPEHEARWQWAWMSSWGLLDGEFDLDAQVNQTIQREAHERVAVAAVGG